MKTRVFAYLRRRSWLMGPAVAVLAVAGLVGGGGSGCGDGYVGIEPIDPIQRPSYLYPPFSWLDGSYNPNIPMVPADTYFWMDFGPNILTGDGSHDGDDDNGLGAGQGGGSLGSSNGADGSTDGAGGGHHHGGGDSAVRAGLGPHRTAARAAQALGWPDLAPACDAAMDHLQHTCGLTPAQISYDGTCDQTSACQAECVLAASCAAVTGAAEATPTEVLALEACSRNCAAQGPATCAEAEAYAHACGVPLSSDWNRDGWCDGQERCVAQCALSVGCGALMGWGSGARAFVACEHACREIDRESAPENVAQLCAGARDGAGDGEIGQGAAATQSATAPIACLRGSGDAQAFCQAQPHATVCGGPGLAYCDSHLDSPLCGDDDGALNPQGWQAYCQARDASHAASQVEPATAGPTTDPYCNYCDRFPTACQADTATP